MSSGEAHEKEVGAGRRFEFGRNWKSFLETVDEDTIREARRSLTGMLDQADLSGLRFLDVGSGSGLFSLAARKMGAVVRSFDYDPQSVECTRIMKQRYFPGDDDWVIQEGSVLDKEYLKSLGTFDLVYAWGVLHHTGAMWEALENVSGLVAKGGRLFLALYNDQGWRSRSWRAVKRVYCSGWPGKAAMCTVFFPFFALVGLGADLVRGKNPVLRYSEYKKSRGMSKYHDWLDWLGGYPFEVSRPPAVVDFFKQKGFNVLKMTTVGSGLGNNQFVFIR
jgi:2-polyprenyl-6-hydroxyphenyl methylase/3-demethylubiquinone-9 3-methyltransferase